VNIALQFGQDNIRSGTCLQLNVFIIQEQGASGTGHLTPSQSAQNIQTPLGCTLASSGNGIVASSLSASEKLSLSLTHSQPQQRQTTASSPSLFQPQSQSPYPI